MSSGQSVQVVQVPGLTFAVSSDFSEVGPLVHLVRVGPAGQAREKSRQRRNERCGAYAKDLCKAIVESLIEGTNVKISDLLTQKIQALVLKQRVQSSLQVTFDISHIFKAHRDTQ